MEDENIYFNDFVIKEGKGDIIISAPHAFKHTYADGKPKEADENTKDLALAINKITNCHIIYLNNKINFDPNNYPNKYQEKLINYIKKNKITKLIDIHGMKNRNISDLDIGTYYNNNLNNNIELIYSIKNFMKRYIDNTTTDRIFNAGGGSISKTVNSVLGIEAIQFEIAKKYRNFLEDQNKFNSLVSHIADLIEFLKYRDCINELSNAKIQLLNNKYNKNKKYVTFTFINYGLEVVFEIDNKEKSMNDLNDILEKCFENIEYNNLNLIIDPLIGDYTYQVLINDHENINIKKVNTVLNIFNEISENKNIYPFIKSISFKLVNKRKFENITKNHDIQFKEIAKI